MPEFHLFEIYNANAEIIDNCMTVSLYYPSNKKMLDKKIPGNLEFGIQVYENLLDHRFSQIAQINRPIMPSCAGSIYTTLDDKIICHRRDIKAPNHKLYHSSYGGFPQSDEELFSAKGIMKLALRETAEECLIITRDRSRLIVPSGSEHYTLESAKRLGIDLAKVKPLVMDVATVEPTDTLKVFDADYNLLFQVQGFIEFMYEGQTTITTSQIRKLPFMADEIFPIDAEGYEIDGKYIHFNRESYILDPNVIKNLQFGAILPSPEVYKTKIVDGIPIIVHPDYTEPYFGPDGVKVVDPHVWASEDLLMRMLDALRIPGYDWIRAELWKEKSKLEGKPLVPIDIVA